MLKKNIKFISANQLIYCALASASITLISSTSFAWGGRGHDSICQASVHLVKSEELKSFLKQRPHIMGHLCNVPDIYWKTLSGDARKHGDPTHFVDPEIIGLKVESIPNSFEQLISKYTGTDYADKSAKKIQSLPIEFGSSWWRADQFVKLATKSASEAKKATPPNNRKEEQNSELPYNQSIYSMMVQMGLLGHFVADNGQPFHTTADYDGYNANHGGIHSYYEEAVVSEFPEDLQALIVKEAKKMKQPKFIQGTDTVQKMKLLASESEKDITTILKLDPIIKPSSLTLEKGMSLKKPAERKPAKEGYKKWNQLIVKQMARSALLLANLWDQIYNEGNKPNLSDYKSYLHPFQPDFVMPDYYKIDTESTSKKSE